MGKAIEITYEEGGFQVRQWERRACKACVAGWDAGTLPRPSVSGVKCTHGRGRWQAGQSGPRGGWYGIGPMYGAELAARIVCEALALAARIPTQGV